MASLGASVLKAWYLVIQSVQKAALGAAFSKLKIQHYAGSSVCAFVSAFTADFGSAFLHSAARDPMMPSTCSAVMSTP